MRNLPLFAFVALLSVSVNANDKNAAAVKAPLTSNPATIGKSYQVIRNALLQDGWVILSRRDFKLYKADQSPVSGGGRTGVCRQLGDRDKPSRFCWIESIEEKRPSKVYADLMDDANWYEEENLLIEFLNPMDVRFKNKVRQIWFSVCNGNYGYCTDKPRGYLEIGSDKLVSRVEAEKGYFSIATRHFVAD